MRVPFPILPAALVALALGFHASPARANEAETEYRLKAIDVGPELRAQVHRAIDGGVRWLKEKQALDGRFPYPRMSNYTPGLTALCGLACRHAGTRDGCGVADRAAGWLMPREGEVRKEVREDIYALSLTLMLLEITGLDRKTGQDLASLIASAQAPRSGWWSYETWILATQWKFSDSKFKAYLDRVANLSTSQFAALGIWAAHGRGDRVDPAVWRKHMEGLIRTQRPSGSWPYDPNDGPRFPGYPTGTFMGIADLALCKTALGGLSSLPEDLRGRVQASEDLGRKALERDGLKFLQDQGSYPHLDFNEFDPNPELHSDAYYGLYSLEKACILTGTERLGSVAWYATGARLLVREQSRDGGWGGHRETMLPEDKGLWVQESDPISTAFALLFLVRMADAYGTATPRPVDSAAGAGVATGKEDIPGGAIEPAAADALGDKDLRDLFDATFAALQGGAAPPEKAAGAFVREGPRVVPLLVRHLEDADIAARRSAIEALQRVTAGGPAFEPDATEETRAAQVAAWMSWWIVRKGRLARDPEHGKFVEKP